MANLFAAQINAWIEKAKGNTETVVKKVGIDLLKNVVLRSPVGNPELWAVNSIAKTYNDQVAEYNAGLRSNPDNLTKAGRLKPGRKLSDGMDIYTPPGYVGGRFRANWQVTFDEPSNVTLPDIDTSRNGNNTVNAGTRVIKAFEAGVESIWMVNNLVYAIPLENGHSQKQAPAGMVKITAAEFQDYVTKAVGELEK